jgi:hypothetical protein
VKIIRIAAVLLAMATVVSGCKTGYSWRPGVPAEKRTLSVPTFRNESDLTEFGSIATRQLLREIQREGTFAVKTNGDAALEVQGVVKRVGANNSGYDRRGGLRFSSYSASCEVEISVIDKISGKVLIDARTFEGRATFAVREDFATSLREASGAMAEDLARQVVDAVLGLKW